MQKEGGAPDVTFNLNDSLAIGISQSHFSVHMFEHLKGRDFVYIITSCHYKHRAIKSYPRTVTTNSQFLCCSYNVSLYSNNEFLIEYFFRHDATFEFNMF